jgi:DNA polymerase-3 subunit alpha
LGLPVRLCIERAEAMAELDLGDEGRFWPSDDALSRWKAVAHGGQAAIVYE